MDKLALLTQVLTQNPNDGLAEFARCIADNPDYVPAYQMSAQTMAAHGQTDAALARLHEGIAAANRTHNQHALAEMDALREDLTR
jgi:hypothetical protein